MLRARFEKTGNALYISHLDLMRVFQRAFKRAGLKLTHSQGFNQRASVSIALPLSLGVESHCELLDFDLEEAVSCPEILRRLNESLIDGVKVPEVYEQGDKIKNIAYLDCHLTLEYDGGILGGTKEALETLFRRPELTVEKKGKNGITQQDIIPLIRSLYLEAENENELTIHARICCQNPSLNPMQLAAAIEKYAPEGQPDFVRCCREEIYDTNENVFR